MIKRIDEIRREFLWKGRKDVKGGHCLVGWQQVCRPLHLGGLGIHNLEVLSWSLHMIWLWLAKNQPDFPGNLLEIQVHPCAAALFASSMCSIVGDGAQTLFWKDRRLFGNSIAELAPELVLAVPKCLLNKLALDRRLSQARFGLEITEATYPCRLLTIFSSSGTLCRMFICLQPQISMFGSLRPQALIR